MLIRRGPDLERYDRELRRPFPSAPQFASESEVWRREHLIAPAARATRTVEPREVIA